MQKTSAEGLFLCAKVGLRETLVIVLSEATATKMRSAGFEMKDNKSFPEPFFSLVMLGGFCALL